jgi:hypothetical protein
LRKTKVVIIWYVKLASTSFAGSFSMNGKIIGKQLVVTTNAISSKSSRKKRALQKSKRKSKMQNMNFKNRQ